MNQQELLNALEMMIDDARAGILATTDAEGRSHLRWMTPIVLRWRPGVLFAFTVPGARKLSHLDVHPEVEWMLQNRALTEVINLQGVMNVIDNPALKAEILESAQHRFSSFWKANVGASEFVVLETILHRAILYYPMRGVRETVELL